MSDHGKKLRIYWPDENRFSYEHPADLKLYEEHCEAAA